MPTNFINNNRSFTVVAKKRRADRVEYNEARKKRRLEGGEKSAKTKTEKQLKAKAETQTEGSGIVYGLNAVTKALEKQELSLVVVCRNVSPTTIIEHIPFLCHHSGTTLCPLQEKSETLGSLFGMKTLVAVGFKVSHHFMLALLYSQPLRKAPGRH